MGRATVGNAFAAVVVALEGTALAGAQASTMEIGRGSVPFRSPTYGYSIELPEGWSAIPAEEELTPGSPPLAGPPITDVFAKRPSRKVSRMTQPAFVVGQSVPPGTSVQEWASTVRGIVADQKGCRAPARTRTTRIGGDAAVLLRYPDCPRELHLDHRWAVVVHGDRGYHLVFWNEAGHETKDSALFDRLLSSVVFEPPTSESPS